MTEQVHIKDSSSALTTLRHAVNVILVVLSMTLLTEGQGKHPLML